MLLSQQVRTPYAGIEQLDIDSCDSTQEFDYYVSQFGRSMHAPLNYYRTTLHRFNEEQGEFAAPFHRGTCSPWGVRHADPTILQAPRPDLPVLLIIGKDDPTSNQGALDVTRKMIPQVQIELIDGVGHWLMIECKDYINEAIPRFVRSASAGDVQTKL